MEQELEPDHLGNPAGRLHAFTKHFRYSDNHGQAMSWHLARYFKLDLGATNGATPEVLRALAELLALPDQIEHDVRSRTAKGTPDEVLLRPLERIRPALASVAGNITLNLQQFQGMYTDSDVDNLEHCSYALKAAGAKPLDPERIAEIRDLARAIMDLATESEELDPEARASIWRHAKSIADAADLARAAGAGLLVDALDEAIGHVVRDPHLRDEKVVESSLGKKFWALLSNLLVAVNLFTGMAAIPQGMHDLLALIPGQSATITAPGPALGGSPNGSGTA